MMPPRWLVAPFLGLSAVMTWRRLRAPHRRGLMLALAPAALGLAILRPEMLAPLAASRAADVVLGVVVAAGLWAWVHHYRRFRRLEVLVTEIVRHAALEGAEGQVGAKGPAAGVRVYAEPAARR